MGTLTASEEELRGHVFLLQDNLHRAIFLSFLFFGEGWGGEEEREGKRTRVERKKGKNVRPGITLKIAPAARQSRVSIHSAQNRIKE